jgi:hypothetical protein
VNVEPSQFLVKVDENDPQVVKDARRSAKAAVERHLRSLGIEKAIKGELRVIQTGKMSPQDALTTLGALDLYGL